MSLQSKPFYWVVCDWPVDGGTHGVSAQENSDYSAWAEQSAALDQAIGDGDWVEDADGQKHYCWDHPRIDQEDLDDGDEAPTPPYLLINNEGEATIVSADV